MIDPLTLTGLAVAGVALLVANRARADKSPRPGKRGRSGRSSSTSSASTSSASTSSASTSSASTSSASTSADELTLDELVTAYPNAEQVAPQLFATAERLGASPRALANLIRFESGWRSTAVNPTSGASGLIQFMPSTAKSLGTTVEAIRSMSSAEQWPLVERYLAPYRGRVGDPIDLFMAVFYPAAIGRPDFEFSAVVKRANPGIGSPKDYYRLAMKGAKL
jgi:hypothetical protein